LQPLTVLGLKKKEKKKLYFSNPFWNGFKYKYNSYNYTAPG